MKDFEAESGGQEFEAACRPRGRKGRRLVRGLQLLGALLVVTLALPVLIPLVAVIGGLGMGLLGLTFGIFMAVVGITLKLLLVGLKLVLGLATLAVGLLPVALCVLGVLYLVDQAERRDAEF